MLFLGILMCQAGALEEDVTVCLCNLVRSPYASSQKHVFEHCRNIMSSTP